MSPSVWERPDGLSVELARIDAEFSAFQQEIKETVLARGFPDRVDDSLRPLADLYMHSWIPLILRWQQFYRENKGWMGKPWQWTHAEEVDRHEAQLSEVRSLARRLMGVPSPTSPPGGRSILATPRPPISTAPSPGPTPEASAPGLSVNHALAIGAVAAIALAVAIAGARP